MQHRYEIFFIKSIVECQFRIYLKHMTHIERSNQNKNIDIQHVWYFISHFLLSYFAIYNRALNR